MSNERINFYYDPAREGYNTAIWKTLAGTPTSTGTALRFNEAKAIGYGDLFKADVTFGVNVPVKPTAGDIRYWGLEQTIEGSKIIFKIIDDVFSCECVFNGITSNTEVVWDDTNWTGANVEFTIKWTGFTVIFLINGVQVASAGGYTGISGYSGVSGRSDDSIPHVALSEVINNENFDDMDVSYIETQNVQGYI